MGFTLEEALKRQTDFQSGPTSIDRVIITSDRILVDDELCRYLEREKGAKSSTDVENEIRLNTPASSIFRRTINRAEPLAAALEGIP